MHMTQGRPLDKLSSNPQRALLQKDRPIASDFLSQERELEHSKRLQQVRMGPELKDHSIKGSWRGRGGVVRTEVMRTTNCGEAMKSG